jgi:hypothetical protein
MHRLTSLLFAVSGGVLLLPSGVAQAGGCLTCTTNAECVAAFGEGVCVLWDRDVGCGALRQLCCPGQGCAFTNGVPSCLGAGCTYVEPPLPDGGPVADGALPDLGEIDGGDQDGAVGPGVDATPRDARTSTGGNTGMGGQPIDRSSCVCAATHRSGSRIGSALLGLALAGLWIVRSGRPGQRGERAQTSPRRSKRPRTEETT